MHVDMSFIAEGATRHGSFDGPLLWTVLDHPHAVTPGQPRIQALQLVLVSGADRYVATLATGELAPDLVRGLDCLDGTPLLDLEPDRTAFTPIAPPQEGAFQVGGQ